MRMLRRIILVVTTILAVAPATAQRYDLKWTPELGPGIAEVKV